MPLVTCPACAKEISAQAPTCPGCGHPFQRPVPGVKDYTCRNCKTKGVESILLESKIKKCPGGAVFVAVLLIVVGAVGLIAYGLGIIGILAGILILSLARREYRILKCPRCSAVRLLG